MAVLSWDDYYAIPDKVENKNIINNLSLSGMDSLIENAPEKKLINAVHDAQMKLEPIKYNWAWKYFLDACANFWVPTEVPTQEDIKQWNTEGVISEQEKQLLKYVLGYFSTVENAIANNAMWVLHKNITNPECRMFLTMQASMESIHQHAYSYCIEILGVDKQEAYDAYNSISTIREKVFWATDKTKELDSVDFTTDTLENKKKLMSNLIAFMLCEGISFFGGFAIILNMNRRNLLPGTCTNVRYIARDETQHCAFAADLIISLKSENPELWDEGVEQEAIKMCEEAVDMESAFVHDALKGDTGVLGMNKESILHYIKYLGCRRLSTIDIKPSEKLLSGVEGRSPLPWLSEMLETKRETAFFERKVIEYQRGGLDW